MKRSAAIAAAAAALGLAAAEAQPAVPPAASPPQNKCFFINEFESWRAPDDKTIFIRVNLNRYYRLDLTTACPLLTAPDSHLITKTRGPDTVCSAVDWDLQVSEPPPANIPEPCIVKSMRQLTPAEVAAIPPRFKP